MAAATATATQKLERPALAGMPVGRRTPRGKRRWYMIHAPRRERSTCARLKHLIPAELLEDAFVLKKEYVRKRHGQWETLILPMYNDYIFVVTRDVIALDKLLSKISPADRICKDNNHFYMPLAEEVQAWFEQMMDATHTIRTSTAYIVNGELEITAGPLKGQEDAIAKITRKHCTCDVAVFDGVSDFNVSVPLVVPFRS